MTMLRPMPSRSDAPAPTKSVYLVEQDVSYLYGEYLFRAVVIAADPEEAIEAAVDFGRDPDPEDRVCVCRDRLTVKRLGPCEAVIDDRVVCASTGADHDQPQTAGDES